MVPTDEFDDKTEGEQSFKGKGTTDPSREASYSAFQELEDRFQSFEDREDGADVAEWLRQEAQSLLEWAVESGAEIDGNAFAEIVAEWKDIGGQSEHHVLLAPDENRVLKTTIPPYFGAGGCVAAYARNLRWSNSLFGDDIRLEGVLRTEAGPMIVTTQPYIAGTEPTLAEIESWFTSQGYEPSGYLQWHHPKTGVRIADAHSGNLIKTPEGYLIPIDLQVRSPGNFAD